MNKLIKITLLILTLVISVNANAGVFVNAGKAAWRDNRDIEGQGIAWEYLNDQVVYAKIKYEEPLDPDGISALCDIAENKYGKRLFDIQDSSLCSDRKKFADFSVYRLTFWETNWTLDFYLFIAPTALKDELSGAIGEFKMGNTINRTPPQLIRVVVKGDSYTDSCKNTGIIRVHVICNGWSLDLLDEYWGKDVPPEMKALNGTGVKAKTAEPVSTTQ